MNLIERLESRIFVSPDSCWIWTGYLNDSGYARLKIDRKMQLVHRVLYKIYREDIPEGLVTDHLCRKRSCVNPYHLEIVTPAENTRRGIMTKNICEHGVGETNCKQGCRAKYQKKAFAKYYQANKVELNKKRMERFRREKGEI